MKKLSWSVVLLFTMKIVSAQILLNENSENSSLGNLSGGWVFTGAADFKVVNSQINGLGKAIQITGPSTPVTTGVLNRSASKQINWGSRTVGNNVVEVKFAVKVVSTKPNSFNYLNIRIEDANGGSTGANINFSKTGGLSTTYYIYNTNNNTVQFESINPNTQTPDGEVGYYIITYDFSETKIRIRRTNANGSIVYADNTYKSGPQAATPTKISLTVPPGGAYLPLALLGPKNAASTVFLIDNIIVSAVPSLATDARSLASAVPSITNGEVNTNNVLVDDVVKTSNLNNSVTVFPNPFIDFVKIESTDATVKINAVTICDITGKVIKQVKYSNVNNAILETSYMAKGIYVLNVYTNRGIIVKKVVKN